MNLPIKLPFLDKKPKTEYYLAILLRDEKITAVVFEQLLGKIKILGRKEEHLPNPLEETSPEELITILDKAISRAEETLPTDVQAVNTVFGVKDTWVEEKKIKKEHLAKLKKLCDELTLTPIGFIILSEAIAHLMQKEEGIPLSALLIELGKLHLTVSLFRAGKLIETNSTLITENAVKTVDTLLKEFERVEILPSRVILFNTVLSESQETVNDTVAQKFIAHQWSKTLPFLHMPQVSILPPGFDTKAIVYGAAVQLGFEMLGLPIDAATDIKTYEKGHLERTSKKDLEEQAEELDEKEVTTKKKHTDEKGLEETLGAVPADNFGFVLEKDITTVPPPERKAEKDSKSHTSSFTINRKDDTHREESAEEEHFGEENADADESRSAKKSSFALPSVAILSTIMSPLRKLMKRSPLPPLPFKGRLLLIPPVFLAAMIGILLLYIFQLKATVTLIVSPKMVDETQKVTFSTTASNDFSKGVIAAKEVSVTLEDVATTQASGEKEVGEKAKGTVTVYNSGDTRRTLREGTTVTSSNGMVYTMDKDVVVASASGDIFTGIKSGTAQVAVTAKNIGIEYNLPSNTKFSVEGSSDIAAKNESAFSGGSKKKVTVVTKKDVDKITEELPKKLEKKAQEELGGKLKSEEASLPGFTTVSFEKKTLSHDIDEESKEVKLTATIKFSASAYQKSDLLELSQIIVKNKFSQDQSLPEKNIETKVGSIKKVNDKEMTGILEINAGLLPKFDNTKIAKELTGKSYEQVQEYIKNLPQVQDAEINLSPNLPFLPKKLPRMSNNITVIMQPNE